jgi:hypothetical protein
MSLHKHNKNRFTFSLPDILTQRHAKGLRRSRRRARRYENRLRMPLSLLDRKM